MWVISIFDFCFSLGPVGYILGFKQTKGTALILRQNGWFCGRGPPFHTYMLILAGIEPCHPLCLTGFP